MKLFVHIKNLPPLKNDNVGVYYKELMMKLAEGDSGPKHPSYISDN